MRRTGQQHDQLAVIFNPLAGGGAAPIGQGLGAFDHERLAPVVVGHFAIQALEAFRQRVEQVLAENQTAPQRFGDGFARDVVLGWAQAAAQNHDAHLRQRLAHRGGQQFAIVAHHHLAAHLDTQPVQLIGEPQGVGIDAVRRQQF